MTSPSIQGHLPSQDRRDEASGGLVLKPDFGQLRGMLGVQPHIIETIINHVSGHNAE
jgi:hypothetical protein